MPGNPSPIPSPKGTPRTLRRRTSPSNPSPRGGGEVRHVAIIDVGKTNSKVSLVDADDAAVLAFRTQANATKTNGPYMHLDASGIWDFICEALSSLNRETAIDAIAITAHGSAGAFLNGEPEGDGLALLILDYEFPGPDELTAEYNSARPDFSESLSPRLPAGLNLGAQIFWQERRFAEAVERARHLRQLPAILGVAAQRNRRDRDVLVRRAFRHVESAKAQLVEHGGEPRLGAKIPGAAPAGVRPARARAAGARDEARAWRGRWRPLRHPRFQRLPASACEGTEAALCGRLDRHLGDPLRGRRRHRKARSGARHARECQRARRSRRMRALHGRARVRNLDGRCPAPRQPKQS